MLFYNRNPVKISLSRGARLHILHLGDYSVNKLVPSAARIVTGSLEFLVECAVLSTV